MTARETAEDTEAKEKSSTSEGVLNHLLLALALGTFCIGTDSLIITGLLSRVAADLEVSAAATGQLITVFAVVYAIGAPILATITGMLDRKRLLVIALAIFIAANVLGAVAPNYPVLMASRVLAAMGAGLFLPCAMIVTVCVTPQRWRGRALAIVTGGISAATALGVPLGTLIGAIGDWRAALLLVAALAAIAVAVLTAAIPQVPSQPAVTIRQRLRAAGHFQVLMALLSNVLACAGEFTAVVYVTLLAKEITDVGAAGVSAFLLASGIAALIGTTVGGRSADRFGGEPTYTGAVVVLSIGLSAMVLLTLGDLPNSWGAKLPFALLLCLVSIASWALAPAQNHRISSMDIPDPTVALSLNGSSTFLGLALGGLFGGLAIEHGSITTLTLAAAGVELLALATLAFAAGLRRRSRPAAR